MSATQLTDFGTDQSPMMRVHPARIRTKWKHATTAKITPAAKENVFASMSDHPKFSGWHTRLVANVQRTKWSPKWSRTRDHGPTFNGMKRYVRPIFAIQINTSQDRTK